MKYILIFLTDGEYTFIILLELIKEMKYIQTMKWKRRNMEDVQS